MKTKDIVIEIKTHCMNCDYRGTIREFKYVAYGEKGKSKTKECPKCGFIEEEEAYSLSLPKKIVKQEIPKPERNFSINFNASELELFKELKRDKNISDTIRESLGLVSFNHNPRNKELIDQKDNAILTVSLSNREFGNIRKKSRDGNRTMANFIKSKLFKKIK